MLRSTASEVNGKAFAHSKFRSARKTSSAGTVSPRSPSAIDSRSSASAAASSSKVSSASRASTVTTAPSGNGSPSTTIFPETTLPEVISISVILTRMRSCRYSVSPTPCRSVASGGRGHAKESKPSAACRLQRLLGRTAPTMESFGDRDRVLCRDPEKRQRRPVWNTATLLPVAQRRHIDTDHERELALRGAQLLSDRLDVGRLERRHPRRAQGAPTNATGLSNACDQLLKRFGFHLNSSRMSAARTRVWFGVRSPCSFLA